ncbi:hypothetical protein LDENG_00064960 [Lucifuga dentata]|nr:hypothetical protein LDENG_00064960 [Lucifuga dentata]
MRCRSGSCGTSSKEAPYCGRPGRSSTDKTDSCNASHRTWRGGLSRLVIGCNLKEAKATRSTDLTHKVVPNSRFGCQWMFLHQVAIQM